MLARVREFDGDLDKLLAEYQQDIESGQPREGRQEFKGCVAGLVRVCLHAERECWVMVLQNPLNVVNCDYERLSERIAHTSVCSERSVWCNTVDAWKTANPCNGCRRDGTCLLLALGDMRVLTCH